MASGPAQDIDPGAVLRSLGRPEPTHIEAVVGGWDTSTWRFATEDGSYHALRVYRSPDRAPAAMRERVALQAAAAAGLPVAAVGGFGGGAGGAAGLNCGTFVHMDFHPLNVLSDGRNITGVVDWTNAAAGDARADLAWTVTLLRMGPLPPSRLRPP